MTAQPTTPTPRPAPKPRPSSPWDNPITIPPIPNYTPTGAEMTAARRRLARYDGDLGRQESATLGILQADITLIAGHLTDHLECDRNCDELAGHVRSAGAISAVFDAAERARRAA